jgi:protein-glucosylgalactosylhydroxylysine glucosidase
MHCFRVEMSSTAKRNNLIHAVRSIEESGAGAMMGTNFVAIIAAELKDDSLFNAVIEKTLRGYLRPPFHVLAETHTNNSINFITGAGSYLQQVIFGYTGLRLTDEGMIEKYKPMLPRTIKSLTLKNFTLDNRKVNIVVRDNNLTITDAE